MQSPTPRPEQQGADVPEKIESGDAPENEARGARRDLRYAASSSANLKLLERRAQAAREASAKREEPPRAPRPPAPEPPPRRPFEAPVVHASSGRRQVALLRKIQLGLGAAGLASMAAFASAAIPVYVPAAVACACLLASVYLSHRASQPLTPLADAARAISLGDWGTRAPAAALGEYSDIARTLNALLDERSATSAQTSEQQQRLQNDIHLLSTVVNAAAGGDLSQRARVQSAVMTKLADELNATLESFAQLVHGVRFAAGALGESVGQAQSLAEQLGQSVSRQGSSLETSAGVVRHVVERSEAVNENAQVAHDAARRTADTAQEGGRMVNRLLEGMLAARRNAQSSAMKMKRLGERATEISAIVGAISRISAQTNMLALNAAIEASRAGEHGLGFTVVADEVRKLAEDCEEATREIARLMTAVQAETNEAVADLEKQAAHVEQQTQLASDAGGALDRILSVSQQSAKLVGEISEVAQQQSGENAGLRDSVQTAGQATREIQATAERAQKVIEILQSTAAELSRRAVAYRIEAGNAGDTTI